MQNQALQAIASGQTMTSRQIAELTGKQHFHVLRDIRVMLAALSGVDAEPERGLGDSENSLINRPNPNLDAGATAVRYDADVAGTPLYEYHLNEELTYTLVTGYDVVARNRVIKEWLALREAALSGQFISIADHEQAMARLKQSLPASSEDEAEGVWEIDELRPYLEALMLERPLSQCVDDVPDGYVTKAELLALAAPFTAKSFFRFLMAVGVGCVWVPKGRMVTPRYSAEQAEVAWRAVFARRLLRQL